MRITLWVTKQCNMKCKYCYENKDKTLGNMTLRTADTILNFIHKSLNDNLKQEKELNISFHGGETLLNFKIIKYIVERIEKGNINLIKSYRLTTNGTIINQQIIDFIKKYNFNISVSVDGDEKSHNLNRLLKNGEGSFKYVNKTINLLIKNKIDFIVRMTVTPNNVENYLNNILFLNNIGIKKISSALDYYNVDWTKEKIDKLRNQYEDIIQMILQDDDRISEYVKNAFESKLIRKTKNVCIIRANSLIIDIFGNIYPCMSLVGMNDFIIGNVFSGYDKQKVKMLNDICAKPVKRCLGCSNYKNCNSVRCKYVNKSINDNYYEPSIVNCCVENINQYLIDKYKEFF